MKLGQVNLIFCFLNFLFIYFLPISALHITTEKFYETDNAVCITLILINGEIIIHNFNSLLFFFVSSNSDKSRICHQTSNKTATTIPVTLTIVYWNGSLSGFRLFRIRWLIKKLHLQPIETGCIIVFQLTSIHAVMLSPSLSLSLAVIERNLFC